MVRMIISDIDGTLLPAGKTAIPARVVDALRRAAEQGIEVVIASGRMFCDLPKDILDMDFVRYVVTCNGAAIWDRETGELIYRKGMPAGQAADILRLLRHYECFTSVYLPETNWNWDEVPEWVDLIYPNRREFFRHDCHRDLAASVEAYDEAVDKIFVAIRSEEARHLIRREISAIPGVRVTSSSVRNLEINHLEADKGGALSWLCQKFDITPEEVVAMGDNENDYNMLSLAGTAVVPANGVEVLKAIATVIALPCERAGIGVYLEDCVLQK